MNRLKIAAVVAGVLALGLLVCPRNPQIDANKLLHRVIAADQRVSYTATQDYTCLYRGKTLRSKAKVVHKPGDGRLASLVCRNYIPLVEGQERVAGRVAWVLRLKPKQKRFPWKQLWVDKRTSIVLASRDWSSANTLKRSMKTIGAIQYISSSTLPKTVLTPIHAMPVTAPEYIPAGFELVSAERSHLVYSDGLYSISIYISKIAEQGTKFAAPRDWGQGLILIGRTKGRKIVVTADLPPKEIERIAHSIGR
ncbi:MAG: MucB/RseB C-terminal domain-containing protein [Armatimonadota bacterium]|nr:MucB/RseB C-terminal domain-containing protein [bacterium]